MATLKLSTEERTTALGSLKGWKDVANRDAIQTEFKFKNFTDAFSFMTAVALEAEKRDHHPEWSNVYNTVKVTLATHDCKCVSQKDIDLAKIMDAYAAKFDKKQ